MAPGRQGPRAWRKENDAGNRRFSVTSSEDVPVSGANVPFEELLARELRRSEGNEVKTAAGASGKAAKKPFLKRGARGWWMRQPGAKQKVVKHTLTSRGEEEEESAAKARPAGQRIQKQHQQTRRRRSSSASSSGTLSPVTTPPEQVRTAPEPPKTVSPPLSPIRRMQFSNQDELDNDDAERRRQQNEELAAWTNASFRSTTSTDIMGMKNLRQSYEAKQEREANEMAEFEAIERDLAAEKEAYLMEKKQQQGQRTTQPGRQDVVPDNQTDHWGLPYSSFVSELHEQELSRWQTTRSEEKLYELEEEVKFYKSETLHLQKRKDHYEQEVKKLALERDEFARYQQEQRLLIEKEWERERVKMKKEEKLQERQWKLRMNATISHQDRKDRGEVETLKAQIVKMQLDEKAYASKWKAVNDNLRQRVTELEGKNHELSDEIKFLEKDRLEQWEKYERLLKDRQDASHMGSKSRATVADFPPTPGQNSDLRTIDDVLAITGTADELLHRWSLPHSDNSDKVREDQDHAFTAGSGYRHRVETATAEDYNPKRYSLDREDAHFSNKPGASTDSTDINNGSANGFLGGAEHTRSNNAAVAYEWALPGAEDDSASHDVVYTDRKPADGDGDIPTLASSLPVHKIVTREIEHAGGKKEVFYTDGSRKIMFPDGNEKEIDASGHVVIKFTNGDHKELFPDTGVTVYYYYEAQTKLTTYPDNRKVYEFPNQQIETSLPDGTTEIQFADGIKKTIHPNGDEFSVFPDGTTMLEQPDGLREVTLLNQKKIRYFPDGQMACVAPGGQETRVRSDSELKQLMEST
ncbi:putative sphingosine kinase [Phytophthora cinnamomi]|uniref:putative sphingosine kinase n=1 Tax=Phytophthora cinnamomi TaxID=4785 RepID=UPI0035599E99|nr:putative sphingosine kinase [Phytophthora cinnamomi]